MMETADKADQLFRRIVLDDHEAFKTMYYDFFAPLCVFARRYIDSAEDCEDVVQEVFYRIWMKRKELYVDTSARHFLMISVRNACLDFLRHKEATNRWVEQWHEERGEVDTSALYTTFELEQLLEKALAKLPEQLASTFRLSRFEGKTYTEIAAEKQISVKTVESYMTKALKFLRVELKDYLPLLAVFIG